MKEIVDAVLLSEGLPLCISDYHFLTEITLVVLKSRYLDTTITKSTRKLKLRSIESIALDQNCAVDTIRRILKNGITLIRDQVEIQSKRSITDSKNPVDVIRALCKEKNIDSSKLSDYDILSQLELEVGYTKYCLSSVVRSNKEVAAMLNRTPKCVWQIIYRAQNKIKSQIES